MSTTFYGGIVYYKDQCFVAPSDGVWDAIVDFVECSPWVGWMLINAWFHVFWVTILTSIQIYQIVFMGMTTNERINKGRYKHFIELGGKSPFNHGPVDNIAEFLKCNCFGYLKHKQKNWMVYATKETEDLIITSEGVQYV
jgi:palmitoyltransferase ZDHHC13/17